MRTTCPTTSCPKANQHWQTSFSSGHCELVQNLQNTHWEASKPVCIWWWSQEQSMTISCIFLQAFVWWYVVSAENGCGCGAEDAWSVESFGAKRLKPKWNFLVSILGVLTVTISIIHSPFLSCYILCTLPYMFSVNTTLTGNPHCISPDAAKTVVAKTPPPGPAHPIPLEGIYVWWALISITLLHCSYSQTLCYLVWFLPYSGQLALCVKQFKVHSLRCTVLLYTSFY